jgi:hypothetical protein
MPFSIRLYSMMSSETQGCSDRGTSLLVCESMALAEVKRRFQGDLRVIKIRSSLLSGNLGQKLGSGTCPTEVRS